MVERAAHDGFDVGSNPARPIFRLKYLSGFKMDYNSKDYERIQLQKLFKTNDFFFLFHSAKLNLNQWMYIEQKLKKLKLKYLKTLNSTALRLFKNSIYKNLTPVIQGFVLFVHSNYKTTELHFNSLQKDFKSSFELVAVKLNNKTYATSQLKGLKTFSYNKSVFNLHQSLDRYLKTTYVLTEKKIISK